MAVDSTNWADTVRLVRIIILWSWALWGFVFAFYPLYGDAVKIDYDRYMKTMGRVPDSEPPEVAKTLFTECSMMYAQLYLLFIFFLGSIRTEHFRVRCCQFFVLDRLVLCPATYLYAAFHYGLHVQWLAYMSIAAAIIFALLGFVAPLIWPIEVEPSKFEPLSICETIVAWIRGFWLWYWIITNLMLYFDGIMKDGIDKSVFSTYMVNAAQLPGGNENQTDFAAWMASTASFEVYTKMASLNAIFLNTQFSLALLFFLLTVRTEYFRVCCCFFLCLDLVILTPSFYTTASRAYGAHVLETFTIVDVFNGSISGFFGILAVGLAYMCKKVEARKSRLSESLMVP